MERGGHLGYDSLAAFSALPHLQHNATSAECRYLADVQSKWHCWVVCRQVLALKCSKANRMTAAALSPGSTLFFFRRLTVVGKTLI